MASKTSIFCEEDIPEKLEGFKNTDFPFPITFGVIGEKIPSKESIKKAMINIQKQRGGYFLDSLWLAEIAESKNSDIHEYFISDDRFRSICLGLNEATNAWALIYGGGKPEEYEELLKELARKRFRIFTAGKASKAIGNKENITSLGERDTGAVYFGQLLMRYALIYGRALVGESHTLTHEIEEYAPGIIFVLSELTPMEHTLIQGLLALGSPVVVLGKDQGLVGTVHAVSTIPEMLDAAWTQPGVRSRLVEKTIPDVPVDVGPIFIREHIKETDIALSIEGSENSFLVIRSNQNIKKDTFIVTGERESPEDFAILVELGNPLIDNIVTYAIEITLLRVLKYAHGVKLNLQGGKVDRFIMTKEAVEAGFKLDHYMKVISTELRNKFPEIGPIKIEIILDRKRVKELFPEINEFVKSRKQAVEEATEETVTAFYGCTRCQSFSLGHACTITPERPSQCGGQLWYILKARALLAPDSVYNPNQIIPKGELLDEVRGEYSGINESTAKRTWGRTQRVYLHSIFNHPHTACSCFQNVAYYIPEVDGIALVSRNFEGATPGGYDWNNLANRVAGYQNREGFASFATMYLYSPKFFKADGGFRRIVWMTDKLKKIAGRAIPKEMRDKIATEKDTRTLEELKRFLKKSRDSLRTQMRTT
jgi:acetyl-CoA decarbonylase/synthase complex subunit beta